MYNVHHVYFIFALLYTVCIYIPRVTSRMSPAQQISLLSHYRLALVTTRTSLSRVGLLKGEEEVAWLMMNSLRSQPTLLGRCEVGGRVAHSLPLLHPYVYPDIAVVSNMGERKHFF